MDNLRMSRYSGNTAGPDGLDPFRSELRAARTAALSHSRPLKYGEHQEDGAQRRRWLEDPYEPHCCIPRCTLTIHDLRARCNLACMPMNCSLESILRVHRIELGLPDTPRSPIRDPVFRAFHIMHRDFVWYGHTGPDMITIDEIERAEDSDVPYISEITHALYQNNFNPEGLRYVFVTNIKNPDTLRFIKQRLYTQVNRGLTWPTSQPQVWDMGTPELDALLGTRLGKTVAYFLLGTFERGTRRIRRIVTWPAQYGGFANMRFDLEVLND